MRTRWLRPAVALFNEVRLKRAGTAREDCRSASAVATATVLTGDATGSDGLAKVTVLASVKATRISEASATIAESEVATLCGDADNPSHSAECRAEEAGLKAAIHRPEGRFDVGYTEDINRYVRHGTPS